MGLVGLQIVAQAREAQHRLLAQSRDQLRIQELLSLKQTPDAAPLIAVMLRLGGLDTGAQTRAQHLPEPLADLPFQLSERLGRIAVVMGVLDDRPLTRGQARAWRAMSLPLTRSRTSHWPSSSLTPPRARW